MKKTKHICSDEQIPYFYFIHFFGFYEVMVVVFLCLFFSVNTQTTSPELNFKRFNCNVHIIFIADKKQHLQTLHF